MNEKRLYFALFSSFFLFLPQCLINIKLIMNVYSMKLETYRKGVVTGSLKQKITFFDTTSQTFRWLDELILKSIFILKLNWVLWIFVEGTRIVSFRRKNTWNTIKILWTLLKNQKHLVNVMTKLFIHQLNCSFVYSRMFKFIHLKQKWSVV